ncbi:MAG: UvrD-helicase domain-containing protein [Proteobacteria bacterium]|nr:UvrD-helicase domain-containing protein [Pseudomonadota bacterium]
MMPLTDPLTLPLDGIRVVEASAGTGKTYTIATLYLRLILERGLAPEAIVVATFTRAATAELATRLRARVVRADALLAGNDPAATRSDDEAEDASVREAIRQALDQSVALDTLRERAHTAALALDGAMIGTLHAFCFRALDEFGFDTGQGLARRELVEDVAALELEIVRDFWRRGSGNPKTAQRLVDGWGSPETLAQQLRDARWRGREASVPKPDDAALNAEFEAMRRRIAGWNESVCKRFAAELERCVETKRTVNERTHAFTELRQWAAGNAARNAFDAKGAASLTADALEDLKPKGERPVGQAFDDIDSLCAADAAFAEASKARELQPLAELLCEARTYLESERPLRLAAQNLVSHDTAIDRLRAALTDATRGKAAAAAMQRRWHAALIDEFQDTDTAQWDIVRRLFGESTLVVVGDPKQSIYGFRGGDVYAWREAVAGSPNPRLTLATSYRSGAGMVAATSALFARDGAFIEKDIECPPGAAAERVALRALLRGDEALPGMLFWRFAATDVGQLDGHAASNARVLAGVESACVGWIVRALADPAMRLRDRDSSLKKLRAENIAVLVGKNEQAASMQASLSRAGVPASCNLRASVYASDEAADLALLLDAIATPDDLRRARAARASMLLGDDAATIAAGVDDDAKQADLLEAIAAASAAVQHQGPLPWLHGLTAQAAPRLLALPDGERRIANYLQLAELLQDLDAASFGIEDLATRFARARADATDDADSARLRLDTDAHAVTVSTVHAAKGLEYDVVLLPYAVLGRDPAASKATVPLYWHHAGNAARVALGQGTPAAIREIAQREIEAETIRVLYVAVTRARALCIVPWGEANAARFSPLHHLLHVLGHATPLATDAAGCAAALEALRERAGAAVGVEALPAGPARRGTRTEPAAVDGLAARAFTRKDLERDLQVWSFSRLVRGSANQASADPQPGAGDADAASSSDEDAGIGGARFGTAVHTAFERTDFAAWRDADGVPDSERALLERCLADEGLAGEHGVSPRAVRLTGDCIRDALNAELPCGVRLCGIAADARKAEIEFHLALRPARAADLYALLHRHGYQQARSGVAPATLHGLLTGKIDLTFTHAGRFHLIDWKTNRCPPYDAAALRTEIALHDYDLQWLIYTLALHRWLGQRLPGYDYHRHVGEAYYLFVRGMADGRGIHVDRPPRELIEAMDALFTTRTEGGA